MKELFKESRINQMILKNRFVRSATWSGLADHLKVNQAIIGLLEGIT
jgi:2,4-dienoyl-CoA reductase-like NADH-dependent reductase (Old Yellow Enzyme family)